MCAFYDLYGLVQWVAFCLKILTGIYVILLIIKELLQNASNNENNHRIYLGCLGSFLFFIVVNLINEMLHEYLQHSLLGIGLWGFSVGNLIILYYCLSVFHRKPLKEDRKIKIIFLTHFIISIISSFLYAVMTYFFYGYEDQGGSLPIWAILVVLPLPLSYFTIQFIIMNCLRKFYRISRNFSEDDIELSIQPFLLKKSFHK